MLVTVTVMSSKENKAKAKWRYMSLNGFYSG